jgi:hypothetical protein
MPIKSRNALMDAAYDDDIHVADRTIDSHRASSPAPALWLCAPQQKKFLGAIRETACHVCILAAGVEA